MFFSPKSFLAWSDELKANKTVCGLVFFSLEGIFVCWGGGIMHILYLSVCVCVIVKWRGGGTSRVIVWERLILKNLYGSTSWATHGLLHCTHFSFSYRGVEESVFLFTRNLAQQELSKKEKLGFFLFRITCYIICVNRTSPGDSSVHLLNIWHGLVRGFE